MCQVQCSVKSEKDTYATPEELRVERGHLSYKEGERGATERALPSRGSELRLPRGGFGKAKPGRQGPRSSWQRRAETQARVEGPGPREQIRAHKLRLEAAQEAKGRRATVGPVFPLRPHH